MSGLKDYFKSCFEPENMGDVPRFRPGDAIRIGDEIGVIVKAIVVVDGQSCNWDRVRIMRGGGSIPSYSVEWKSDSRLRSAWWQAQEFDELIQIGPFQR